jgi:uncharacterized lipoprotein YmbA
MSWTRRITLLAAVSLLAACASTPTERFYTLNAPSAALSSNTAPAYSVALGAVELPEMVDRPQLVVRTSANRVAVLEQQRWAEALKSAIPRVLAASLGAQLGGIPVAVRGDAAARNAKYRIAVQIGQLESELDRAVTLDATWSIRSASGAVLPSGKLHVREATQGSGYEALVAAHERALVRLSAELAQGIQSAQQVKPVSP